MIPRSEQTTRYNIDSTYYCNLCNKIPWIPMFPRNLELPILKDHHYNLPQTQSQSLQNKFNYLPKKSSLPIYNPSHSNSESVTVQKAIQIVPFQKFNNFESSIEYPPEIIHFDYHNKSKITNDLLPKASKLTSLNDNHSIKLDINILSNPIIVDNYPEASSYNLSIHQNQIPQNVSITNHNNVITEFEGPITNISPIFYSTIESNDNNLTKTDRQTPKKLLDLPIFYTSGSSPRSFTKNPNKNFTQLYTTTLLPIIPSLNYTLSSKAFQFQSLSTRIPNNNSSSKKRAKYIHQLIIPYTTKIQPRPFKVRDKQQQNNQHFSNWFHSHEEIESHVKQESSLIDVTETPVKKSTQYFTKILATNLRELLKKEYEPKNKLIPFDIAKLQKNIDDWTEQEFTSSHKIVTQRRSKKIPNEYLITTTPIIRTSTTNPVKNNQFHNTYLFKENGIKTISTDSNKFQQHTTTTTTTTIKNKISSTTTKSIAATSSYDNLWKKLKVSISPITNEKIYVVTPEPLNLYHHKTTYTDSSDIFKSPRFLIRPAPNLQIKKNN